MILEPFFAIMSRYVITEKGFFMEIELKFSVPDEETRQAIWEDELFELCEEKDSREELFFHARYYDTEDGDLAKNGIAYRVRMEGDTPVATLKCKGNSEEGLHQREEINIPASGPEPDPELFGECSLGNTFIELIKGKELKCCVETKINRKSFRIDTGDGIFEFSLDEGEVITEKGSIPISELEIELYSGDTEELLRVGDKVQKKFGLETEDKSKYAKGMEMIEGR